MPLMVMRSYRTATVLGSRRLSYPLPPDTNAYGEPT